MSSRIELQVPAHALPQRSVRELLTMARTGLDEARQTRPDGLRYATAHLSALRAAASVLAARAVPAPGVRRSRPTSVWTLVVMVAPELTDWAETFAAGASKRAAAEAGIPRVVTASEADALILRAEEFITIVETALGLSKSLTSGCGVAACEAACGNCRESAYIEPPRTVKS